MDADVWLYPVVLLLLILASAFFSSVESAYFSLGRSALSRLAESNDPRARRVYHLMQRPRLLLASILSGNTVINTTIAAIAALWAIRIAESLNIASGLAITIEVVSITLLILYFGELIPKIQALRNAESWALHTSSIVEMVTVVTFPLAWPLSKLAILLSRLFGVEQHRVLSMSEEEIRALVEVSHEHGALEKEERQMIHSIFELGDTMVREVMVPRIDIGAVPSNAGLDEILTMVKQFGHSRIPVYDRNIDNIVGIVHVKDLLQGVQNPEAFDLMKSIRKVYVVPEEKKVDDLLREFQKEKVHMAIVLDEYGGTAGLVTLEDVIEEIVGEIQDEYDKEQPLSVRIDDRTVIASGRLSIYDLNQVTGYELIEESDSYDTVGGFVYSQLGVVPRRGDQFEFNSHIFKVEELLGRRITRIRIEKIETVFKDA